MRFTGNVRGRAPGNQLLLPGNVFTVSRICKGKVLSQKKIEVHGLSSDLEVPFLETTNQQNDAQSPPSPPKHSQRSVKDTVSTATLGPRQLGHGLLLVSPTPAPLENDSWSPHTISQNDRLPDKQSESRVYTPNPLTYPPPCRAPMRHSAANDRIDRTTTATGPCIAHGQILATAKSTVSPLTAPTNAAAKKGPAVRTSPLASRAVTIPPQRFVH